MKAAIKVREIKNSAVVSWLSDYAQAFEVEAKISGKYELSLSLANLGWILSLPQQSIKAFYFLSKAVFST